MHNLLQVVEWSWKPKICMPRLPVYGLATPMTRMDRVEGFYFICDLIFDHVQYLNYFGMFKCKLKVKFPFFPLQGWHSGKISYVALVQFPPATLYIYVGWACCWFLALLQDIFL